ncbi:MAG: CYTH domain-containing protein [Muribaculaceae bacterium]|nr:CYTH domain-containing protein [Muribaculaceae bacterium]
MAKEIERKFLVADMSFRDMARASERIVQGYLSLRPEATVRVRLRGNSGFLTVKGPNHGAVRDEWEYAIPATDAMQMLQRLQCGGVIDKTRYLVDYAGHTWEVDEFHGALAPLVLAEVELTDASEVVEIPPFIAEEVTGDVRYYNSTLAASVG